MRGRWGGVPVPRASLRSRLGVRMMLPVKYLRQFAHMGLWLQRWTLLRMLRLQTVQLGLREALREERIGHLLSGLGAARRTLPAGVEDEAR